MCFVALLSVWACAALLTAIAAASESPSDEQLRNWHQWRGPHATGVAPLGDPPIRWAESTNIKWKVPVPGRGTSTPIIWNDRIFLLTAINTGRQGSSSPTGAADRDADLVRRNREPTELHQFVVLCIDRESGQTLWNEVAREVVPHQRHHPTSSFAAFSPITDGERLYCSFGSRGVYCFDMEGNLQWDTDLGQFEIKYSFGEGSSPALYDDTLIVNCDHEGDSFITALDAATGEEKWKTPRDEKSTWNTPLVVEHNGRTQVLVNGAVGARSYDFKTGELLWEYRERPGVDAIPSPLHCGDLAIFVSGLRGDPAYAIPLRSLGDLTDSAQLAWRHPDGTPQIATPVLLGDRLYFTKDRAGILTCLNALNGQVIMQNRRLPGLDDIYPSPVAAAGRVYFTARNGATTVIDGHSNQLVVLAENKLDETIVGSPAIAGRQIFIRGERSLYCIEE